MIALLVGLTYPLLLLVAVGVLALLLVAEGRRARRAEALAAEQHARPAGADPPTEIAGTLPGHHATARRITKEQHRA